MTKKQQVIANGYGEYWELLKDYINEDGWIWDGKIPYPEFFKTDNLDIKTGAYEELLYRPKSLQGIENNNWWIAIESEDDLPKESCRIWVKLKDLEESEICHFTNAFFTPIHKTCTHYQLITPPSKPHY